MGDGASETLGYTHGPFVGFKWRSGAAEAFCDTCTPDGGYVSFGLGWMGTNCVALNPSFENVLDVARRVL